MSKIHLLRHRPGTILTEVVLVFLLLFTDLLLRFQLTRPLGSRGLSSSLPRPPFRESIRSFAVTSWKKTSVLLYLVTSPSSSFFIRTRHWDNRCQRLAMAVNCLRIADIVNHPHVMKLRLDSAENLLASDERALSPLIATKDRTSHRVQLVNLYLPSFLLILSSASFFLFLFPPFLRLPVFFSS